MVRNERGDRQLERHSHDQDVTPDHRKGTPKGPLVKGGVLVFVITVFCEYIQTTRLIRTVRPLSAACF